MVPIGVRQESGGSTHLPNLPLWMQGTSFLRARQVIGIACLFLIAYLRSPEQASLLTFAGLIPVIPLKVMVQPVIKMEHSYYQNGTLIKMEHSYYQNGTLIKMEHSY